MSSVAERLRALARTDKWYLSCGDGILWAPPFPVWLHTPGYWDEALIHYHPFAPLFSVALVDSAGTALPLERRSWIWQPDRIEVTWSAPEYGTLDETRFALPGGRFVSAWRGPKAGEPVRLAAFTAQPGGATSDLARERLGLRWRRSLTDRRGAPLDVTARLLVHRATDVRAAARRSEGADPQPVWVRSPFWELWRAHGELPDDARFSGITTDGLAYLAVTATPDAQGSVTFEFQIQPHWPHRSSTTPETEAGTRRRIANSSSPDGATPVGGAEDGDIGLPDVSGAFWTGFLEQFPRFTCSDAFCDRYYDYRLYGLGLNRLAPAGLVRHPAIAEGIGYFHVPITYSAQCHMWEMRWASDPSAARGSLLNFLDHQRPDGSFHGRLYPTDLERTDFYHANWGDAVDAVQAVHPDPDFLRRAYAGLARYAAWLDRSRDDDGSGMYDVVNHYETGQEYMSRYQVVAPDADRRGWESVMRLKAVDVTVYGYQLQCALSRWAAQLGRDGDAAAWDARARCVGRAVIERMWDPRRQFFADVDPRTGARTAVSAAVGFYPLLTDLVSEAQVRALLRHLTDARAFATPFPVPSSPLDDPRFSAFAEWEGKRHNCPWNGRVWPMVNSHVIEGLLRQWHAGRREAGPAAARLLTTFVRMMFTDGDPARPNCFEHYHPFTGQGSVYRGIDDYQHSWVADLLVRGLAGLEPRGDELLVDPLPLDLSHASVENAVIRGRSVSIERSGERLEATVDGRAYESVVGRPLRIPLA